MTRIEITPASASIKPGDSLKFAAIGYDQHGSPLEDTSVTWSATGGTIDQEGRFTAERIGDFRVEARSDSIVGTATINVQTAPPPPVLPRKGCAWQGTVPPQKWMNFYTKVLSPLVSTTPGLKLQVEFEVPPGDSAIETKVEAAKAALRDLGLPEDVQMR
ncbi:MAG: Ig-like domain-containing protein [Planctomycetaceae bacterium]|nr:Ig-like domain-containing protein [Planctomycetaceae bacterium]